MDVSEDNNSGLYSKALPWLNSIDDHYMYKIDLEQVKLNLMKNVEHGSTYSPLTKRAMINFIKEACGQVREVKFQKYSEWYYNKYFGIVYQKWFEMKTLEKYSSGMAPQFFRFLSDNFTPLPIYGHVMKHPRIWR